MKLSSYFLMLSLISLTLAGIALILFKYLYASIQTGLALAQALTAGTSKAVAANGAETISWLIGVGIVSLVCGVVCRQKEQLKPIE
jgi:general stress protein CsbA